MKENLSLLKDLLQLRIKIKIYKHMPVVSKNVYVDELGNIDNRYNNIYHRTIRLKSIYNKTSTYIDFVVKNNVCESCKNIKYKNILHSKLVVRIVCF